MGSEQSQSGNGAGGRGDTGAAGHSSKTAPGNSRSGPSSHAGPSAAHRPFGVHNRPMSATAARLQRGNTIAVSGQSDGGASPQQSDSRPASPPMSVCSDSDLPYISYTDKPIGDSPKLRNKGPGAAAAAAAAAHRNASARNSMYETSTAAVRRPAFAGKPRPASSTFVVVQEAPQKELDADLQRIQSIPQFLPVMRGSHHSLPANRDPEVLERLQPGHLTNICQRMQTHLHLCAARVSADQNAINSRIRDVEAEAAKVLAVMYEKQKLYATYADHFSKVRLVSQQLSRCTALLHQNLEAVEQLNDLLEPEQRLEPFVWPAKAAAVVVG